MSFVFGGNTNLTYEQLQERRKIAEELMNGGYQQPQNWAQGLSNSIGDIAGVIMRKKADAGLAEGRKQATDAFSKIFGGEGSSGGGYGGPAGSAAPRKPSKWEEAAALGLDLGSADGGQDTLVAGWDTGRDAFPTIPTEIKNGIFAGESGGDYDALFGYSNRPGGRFAGTKLTDMTVDEALEFANPSGPYGQHVKGQIGRVATPMGAYQVVGTTLRDAKKGLGLTGSERMTPELQDAIGGWIYANQGTGAWEGYRGPQDSPPTISAQGSYVQKAQATPDMAQLLQLSANPYLSEQQRGIVNLLAQQQMQRMDPAYQLDMDYKRAQLDNLRNPQAKPTISQQDYNFYAEQERKEGRQPLSFNEWKLQTAKAGAPSVSTTVNTGDPVDSRPMADKPDKGYQRRWDEENRTWVDEPIPGSNEARDIAEAEDKKAERARQTAIKMGPTLENLHLNITEVENGGVPVTGLIGALGGMIPGTAQRDFRNRTQQISTRGALDEVQNMRDNSPTGGAVGQLTDSEREAIGLAATGLANSSSAEEYVRNAKNFRKLMLDTAHGAGNWKISRDGQVIVGQAYGADFSEMSLQDLLNVDIMTLDSAGMDAYEGRMKELGL